MTRRRDRPGKSVESLVLLACIARTAANLHMAPCLNPGLSRVGGQSTLCALVARVEEGVRTHPGTCSSAGESLRPGRGRDTFEKVGGGVPSRPPPTAAKPGPPWPPPPPRRRRIRTEGGRVRAIRPGSVPHEHLSAVEAVRARH